MLLAKKGYYTGICSVFAPRYPHCKGKLTFKAFSEVSCNDEF